MSKTATIEKMGRAEHLQALRSEAQETYLACVSSEANEEPFDNGQLDTALARIGLNEQSFQRDVQALRLARGHVDSMMPAEQIKEQEDQLLKLDRELHAEMVENLTLALKHMPVGEMFLVADKMIIRHEGAPNEMLEEWRARIAACQRRDFHAENGAIRRKIAELREQNPRVAALIEEIEKGG